MQPATVVKRRGPISEKHREALRQAQLRRWAVESTPTGMPPVLLRLELMAARRAGRSFESFWPAAVESAVSGTGRGRQDWIEALTQTRGAWERAYRRDEGQPCWGALQGARI